jgi:hypothetical protein
VAERVVPGTAKNNAPFSCTRHETTEMMTLSRGFRGDAGAPLQPATPVAAPALIVTTECAAVWAGPAASGGGACVAGPPSPAPVKRVIVPPAAHPPAAAAPAGTLLDVASMAAAPHPPSRVMSQRMTILTGGAPMSFAAGPVTRLSRRAVAAGRQRRAPPSQNLRQATELAPS